MRLPGIGWIYIAVFLGFQCIGKGFCEEYSRIMKTIITEVGSGNYRNAEKAVVRYVDAYPDRIGGYLLLGRIYYAINHLNARDSADRLFKKVLSFDPSDYLANLYVRAITSDPVDCVNSEVFPVLGIMRDQPDNPGLFQRLHSGIDNLIALRGVAELKQTAVEIERAIESGLKHYLLDYELGRVYLALGDAHRAEEYLQRALDVNGNYTPILHVMAQSFLLQNVITSFNEYYLNWLKSETDDMALRQEMRLLELIVEEDDITAFRKMSLEDKKKYFAGFLEQKPKSSGEPALSFDGFYKNIVLFIYGTEIDPKEISMKSPALAFVCAALPGAIVRGAGHMYAGHKKTGYLLLAINTVALIELSFVVASGVGCIEGCPDRVEEKINALGAIGLSVFLGTWAYDLIGAPYKCHRDNEKKKRAIAVRPYIARDKFRASYGLNVRFAF